MGVLKVKVNGVWEEASAAVAEPPPEEVWTGTASPDPAKPYELWVDTSTDPPTLKVKNDIGQWKEASTTTSEVEVSTVDPLALNPLAEVWYDPTAIEVGHLSEVEISSDDPLTRNSASELWYLPGQKVPAVPPALWDTGVTYQLGDWCEHPLTEFWRALRITVGDEPGVVADAWTMWSPPPAADIPGYLRANVFGLWQDIVSDVAIPDEVWISPDEPTDLTVEVWVDTDEPPPLPPDLVDVLEPYSLKAQVHARHIAGPITSGALEVTLTLKAGTYLCQFQMSAVATVTGIRYMNLDMESPPGTWTTVGQSKHWFNAVNIHYVMSNGVAQVVIPADGDYPFRLSLSASIAVDANDFGYFTLTPCEPGAVTS